MSKRVVMLVVGMAIMALLAGCGQQAAGSGEDAAAREAFLKERAGTPTPGLVEEFAGGDFPGAFGAVEKVEGNEIIVKNPMSGETTVIRLAEDGVVRKQANAEMSDVKVGETIMAIGTKDGDTLTAEMVNVGGKGGGMFGGGPVQMRRPGDGNGPGGSVPPGRGQIFSGNLEKPVSGTVKSVEGDTITVEAEDGTTSTVKTTSDTRFRKQVEVPLSDVEPGMQVSAMGEKNDGVLEATEVMIVEMVLIER